MSWDTIIADPEFQALEPDRKQKIANNYFAKNFESDKDFISLPEEKRFKIKSNFESTLNIEKPLPSRSIVGDVLSAAARSPLRLGERIGSSLKYFDQPGGLDIARNIGETLTELPEKVAERFDIFKPSQQESKPGVGGLVRRAVTGGIQELPSSIAPALAGGATGLAIGSMIPIPGAPLIGSYVGAAAGTFGQFYTSSYQEAYEDAIKQGIPEDKARSVARKIGLIQGGIEAVTTPITLGFAMGKNVLKNLFVAPSKEAGKTIISEAGKKAIAEGTEAVLNKSIRSVLTPTIKEAAKTIGKVSAIEVPQEMVQDELDALVRRQAGMEAPAFGESAIEAAGPAAVMSILMGGGGHVYNKAYTGSVKRALQNPKGIDKEARLKAAQFTASTIAEESKNPFLGQLWLDNAERDIEAGKPISLESNIKDLAIEPLEKPQKPKTTGLKIEQPIKAEVPKFESEPMIKVKGEGLKIEPVIEKPVEKKPIVSHEEDILVKGEKPVTLEKPVSKPITEGLPIEREIPVTLEPQNEIDNFIKESLKYKKEEIRAITEKANKAREAGKEEIAGIYEGQIRDYNSINDEDFINSVRNNPRYYLSNQNIDPFLRYKNIDINLPNNIKAKEVISSEETKGQEAKRGLPLKPVSFVSVQDARSWIKQKSKEYGGRNQFLASKEYENVYPEVKRVFDEQKQKEKENIAKANEVKIKKEKDGTFSLNFVQRPDSYVASGGGLYGGKATYKTEAEAIEKALKMGLIIVPEQGTSPETKGLPAGEAAPAVSEEPWQITREEIKSPSDLIFTEKEQHRKKDVLERFDVDDMPPITMVDDYGIIDGHNRALLAKEANVEIKTISITEELFNEMKDAGFDEIEISYAMLRDKGYSQEAQYLEQQFPGAGVEKEGEKAFDFMIEKQRQGIKQALSEGKPVPPEVLKDYPDLQKTVAGLPEKTSPATHTMPSGEVMPGAEHKETKQIPIVKSDRTAKKAGLVTDDLLIRRAIEKAESVKDEYNLLMFSRMNKKKLSNADRSLLNVYLFGDAEGRPAETLLKEGEYAKGLREDEGRIPEGRAVEEGLTEKSRKDLEQQAQEEPSGEKALKTETPATPISPIEAKIKKEIPEGESLTSQQTLADQLHTAQPALTQEEANAVTTFMVDPLAKVLAITPEEVASEYIKQIKASTMAELEGREVTYQPSGLPDDVVTKIETSLINNTFDDSISTNALRRYGKPHFVTISPSTPKQEAFTRLRRFLIDNPKGYDIVGGRTVLTDKEYLEGKRNKVQYQSQEQAQEFYSHLEDVVEKSSQTRYVPQQLLNYLKAQGVKDAEIEATGLKEYLKEKGNVSKDELLEYLKGNQVEIKVKEFSDTKYNELDKKVRDLSIMIDISNIDLLESYPVLPKNILEKLKPLKNEVLSLRRKNKTNPAQSRQDSIADVKEWDNLRNQYQEIVGDFLDTEIKIARIQLDRIKPLKFSKYVEPGGENYREILLALPEKKSIPSYEEWRKLKEPEKDIFFPDLKSDEPLPTTEVEWKALYEKEKRPMREVDAYKSTHYDEPNIVAHIRIDDRIDTNGKKVLFVEEIQSDWATEGKKKGFKRELTVNEKSELQELKNILLEEGQDKLTSAQDSRLRQLEGIGGMYGIPSFPFSKTWHELALKHVLRYASENGYDSIAWTTGEMQQNRYDLSKQVSRILYTKIGDGTFSVTPFDNDGKVITNYFSKKPEELGDIIGKGISEKIVKGEGVKDKESGRMELSGLGLKVGGKWAERLYDEMIPQFLNKYTKKWGGKVSTTNYIAAINAAFDLEKQAKYGTPVQSLDITPSMRQSILQEGQPLFQGNRGAIEFTKDGKAIIHILENADKSTFVHEMFHLYVDIMKRTPKLKAQLKILETWIGKPVDKWTVADNEKVAKGGEKYLWEGNAPTSALKAVFARFKEWLQAVYKTAKGLDIKLSDDVRKMWDEWFGGKKPEIETKEVAIIPTRAEVVTKEIAKSSIGTIDNIDTIALSDIFKSEIDRGTPLNKLLVKRIVAGKLGVLVGDLIPEKGYKHKAVEEAYEYAIVKKGREIAQSDMSVDEKFEATKKLYAQQLNLSERTSSSIEKQQYSTPLPLAMAINEHLGIDKNTTVYEPTAGNGILLIGANPKKTVANELAADYRQTHLKDTGFSTIQGDAMTFIKDTGMDKSFNTVVMNPPFGNAEVKLFDNYRVRKLEHQIALESLKAMEDNGNAAIIIGGHNFEHGKMTESDRIFLNYLYSHYNVTHNIDINGDVYRRMGTSFPIRLLIVEGRKATPDNQFAPTEQSQVESANTFDDVRNLLGKPIQKEMEVKREDIGKEPIITRLPGKEGRGVEGITEGRQKGDEPARGVRDIAPGLGVPDTGLVEQPGYSKDIVGDIVRKERGRGRTELSTEVTRGEGVRPEELPGQLPLPSKQSRLADANIQVPYVPKSKGKSGGNVIPKNLAEPIAKVLQKIEDIYGDIDNFIQKELKYKTREDLFDALSAEQIDAVSIIISNIKNGKSTILGDQTGVGKGRSVAATIRYANLQGIKPIFFTEKPNLLTDIYRDLVDINHKINPFVLHSNSNSTILDQEGNKVFKPSFVGELKTNMTQDPVKEMENYNVLMTTYSQVNKENKQRAILRMLAQGNIIILDESHNAAGTSNTGEFLSKLLEAAETVVYSSATYAKRPDNMAVYHKTDIGKTGLSVERLTDAIKLGGIPLQQWVASALAEGGQYTRTELDYSGTNLDITLDIKNESLHTKQSDAITSILRDIVKFDREKLKIIKEMDKEAVKEGKRTTGEDSTAAGVTSSNFSSVVHNMVGQLLLSFRTDAAVEKAITAVKEGRKPVITLMNTMETFLSNTVAEGNVNIGDPIGFSFKDVLKKALKGTLRYTEISPGGERFKKVFKLEELPDSVQAIYRNIESKINSLETTLPSSPIDYIKSKLVKAGYTVGEITNRKLYVDYSKTVPTLEAREETERRDRNAIINAFNSGKTKILIFNAAGATGISLHASEKFATDKEQRELLIVQPQLNIDTFKQAMGRVFRKGQVSKPRFTMIQTALPAEIRPTVILQKKLASLNANTTANKESSAGLKDVPDMMNSYGDSVVSAYLKQNSEINAMLGDPLGIEADKENAVDAMQKVTGKVALLPVQIQRQFYDDIEMAYKELIEHLDQIGENNLHTKEYNFQAKTLEKQVTNQGTDESNLFASSTYLEKISVKVLKKPFTKAKIEELVKDSLKGKTAEDFNKELLSKIEEITEQYKDALEGELIEKRKEEIQYDVNLIDYAFKKFKIGYSYSIPIIEDVYTPAVLVDIKHSKTSGNPAAPSKVHLVFAAAPPYQIYKTSLSRKEFISHADSTGEGIPSGWDELIPKEVRENRHVITGNLLQGFQRLGERAETINYTTESGEVKAGILLPRSTDINSLKEGGTTVGSKEAFDYLQSHNYIESADKEVTIRVSKETATINVPKSKSDGAKYYLNKPLLSLVNVEFSSFGNSMRSHVSIDKLLPLLETLEQETSTRFSIPAKEVAPSETVTEEKTGEETAENAGKIFFQEAHKESFITNVVDKILNWNEEKKAYREAVDNGIIKEDLSDDFRNKVKQWVSFPRTVAKKYPVFKRFYGRAEKYFEDVDNYATTMGNTVKPYVDSANQETVNKLLIDARLNKQYAYRKEELQKAGYSEEVIKEYLSVVNTMNQGLHYMANMLNRSGNDIEEIYNFVSKVKGMKNLLKPYKALENKDNINKVLSKTVWGKKVFRKQELIDLGLTEEERLAYNSITKLMFKNSNYVPFKRYGDWFVAVNDADGNLVEYSFHESQKEMRAEALAMVEKYPENKVTSGNVKKMATEAYQNMPVSILTMLKEFDKELDTEFSKVYANITGRGFPLHLIESKKILGFEKDLSKSISDYILGISRWMAAKEARHDFSKMFVEKDAEGKLLLDPRKQAQLYGYTDRYVNYILGNSKEGSRFRQFMFRYYLGGVVKSALINFTQSLTSTLPTAAKYIAGSIIRRSRLMADAVKIAAIPIDKLKITNPRLAEALQKALKDGVISEQMVKMLRGEVYGKKLNKLDKILSYMFEFAEQSNRKIAFIMAYNEATTNGVKTEGRRGGYSVLGHEEAIKFAEDFVKETQFEYCVDTDTEILTTNGWKKYNETRKGDIVYGVDNNLNTIQTKIENIHIYAGNHEVIKFSNKHGFEMVLTPNHDCLVQNYNSGNKKWCKAIKRKAANINTGHHLVRIGLPYQSDIEEIYTDDFVKLLAWILAEGCYHKFHCQWYRKGVLIRKTPVKNNNIRLYQSIKHNPLYVEEIEQLLLNLGGHYKRFCKNQHQGNNLITWTIKKPLSSKILEIIPDKLITKELVNNLSVRQMGLFIETFSKGDGTLLERGGWLITQKAKINLDYIQMMNTLCGKTSNLYDLNQRTKCYSLYLAKNIRRTSCNECKKEKTVVDTIWCPETTSGNWIARRNGRVFVTGNSKLNKSELMRGWKAPLFTFRVFAGSYLSLLKSMMLEGEWKALSEALGIMLLLGGLVVFPGLKEIEKALELMGYDPKKGIKKRFGKWGDLSLHGILYPLGIDLSGALGTIEIVPGDIQQGIVPAVGGLILGVPMDIPKRMGRAWTLLTKNKDVYRAVEAIMPEAIRNPMVAVRWIKEGEAKAPSYEPITKVGSFDTALKFLGIQPATLSKAYEREHSESILRNINYSEGYNWRIAKALYKKDSDGYKDILEEIRKHNVKIGKAIFGGDKEAVKKYILPTRQGIQRNLLKMISPQASELKSMPKVLRPAYREIQEVMN